MIDTRLASALADRYLLATVSAADSRGSADVAEATGRPAQPGMASCGWCVSSHTAALRPPQRGSPRCHVAIDQGGGTALHALQQAGNDCGGTQAYQKLQMCGHVAEFQQPRPLLPNNDGEMLPRTAASAATRAPSWSVSDA